MLVKYRQFIDKYPALQFLSVIISPRSRSQESFFPSFWRQQSTARVWLRWCDDGTCPINHPFIHLSLFPVSSQHQNLYIIGPILTFYTIVPPRFFKIRCVKSWCYHTSMTPRRFVLHVSGLAPSKLKNFPSLRLTEDWLSWWIPSSEWCPKKWTFKRPHQLNGSWLVYI